ncbi:MAG TPA: T9SS type A sorting domain-containing protein [Chitinophagaceae bacterium]
MRIIKPVFIFLHFLLSVFITNAQSGWNEIKSDVVNALNTVEINALAKDATGTIVYAAVGNNVLKWQANVWTQLGTLNTNSAINTLTTDAAGNVYAAGFFSNANNFAYVAKWNGTSWSELGSGANALNANGVIYSLTTDPAGNIYAAGSFNNTVGKKYVAKWNGTTWSELGGLGALSANGFIWSVASDASGNIYAGGGFTNANNKSYVAKWNGASWSELGGVNALGANSGILTVTTDPAGNVYAGGQFTNATNKRYVAKWNGTAWAELGTGANALNASDWIVTIIADGSGNVYAGGNFANSAGQYVAKWNGTNWTELGAGANSLHANGVINSLIRLSSGDVYATGSFTNGASYTFVAKWNAGTDTWSETGSGGTGSLNANGDINVIHKDINNYLYAAGAFGFGFAGRSISRWNGTVWTETGSGTNALHANNIIRTLTSDAKGNIYVGGFFTNGSGPGLGKYYIAKFNGSSWSELGGLNALNANGPIFTLAVDIQGNVYAGGAFTNSSGRCYVAKWTAATNTWSELGGLNGLNANGSIQTIALDGSGNVYAAGSFTTINIFVAYVAKWNGTSWSPLGPTENTGALNADAIGKIAVVNPNLIYVYGSGITAGGGFGALGKWDGTTWTRIGGNNGIVLDGPFGDMTLDNSGNVYAAGSFGNLLGRTVLKYNGSVWTQVGTGTESLTANNYIHSVIVNGDSIYAGGVFVNANFKCYVAGYNLTALPQPDVRQVSNKCQNSSAVKGKLANPPPNVTITITEDGSPISYSSVDSSFTYFTSGVTPVGNHLVRVQYVNATVTKQKDTAYSVLPIVTPAITLSGSTTVATGQVTTLIAITTNGGSQASFQWQDSTNSTGWKDIFAATDSIVDYYPAATGHKIRMKLTSSLPCINPITVTSAALTFTVNLTTGIAPVSANQSNIRVYPNPVHKELIIDSLKLSDRWISFELFTNVGNRVIVRPLANQTNITQTMSFLPNGFYMIVLRRKNGASAYAKIIKQ